MNEDWLAFDLDLNLVYGRIVDVAHLDHVEAINTIDNKIAKAEVRVGLGVLH